MLQQFLNHIESHTRCGKQDKVLLAVSGGVDSMVMLDLFLKAGYQVGIAHCNFKLRGADSDADEQLVRDTAEKQGIPVHVSAFDTEEFAWSRGLSIQVAARELRYRFFEDLVRGYNYAAVATAHHLNDSIETVLLNLTRGTGIDGLTGIPARNGRVIRPLLPFTRKVIRDYAVREQVIWREDSSNLSDHYTRNVIRHQVIPILESINTDFESNFLDTLERIQGTRTLARIELKRFEAEAVVREHDQVRIRKTALSDHEFPAFVLWEILKSSGFHYNECKDIVRSHQPGKIFRNKTHEVVVDREFLIVKPNVPRKEIARQIAQEEITVIVGNQQLTLERHPIENFKLSKDKHIAQIDASRVKFPLLWRHWHAGDSFSPLGMKTHKKISDFLIDLKVSRVDKEQVTILESGGEIIWVVGLRISDKVKVTEHTRSVLHIAWQKNH